MQACKAGYFACHPNQVHMHRHTWGTLACTGTDNAQNASNPRNCQNFPLPSYSSMHSTLVALHGTLSHFPMRARVQFSQHVSLSRNSAQCLKDACACAREQPLQARAFGILRAACSNKDQTVRDLTIFQHSAGCCHNFHINPNPTICCQMPPPQCLLASTFGATSHVVS